METVGQQQVEGRSAESPAPRAGTSDRPEIANSGNWRRHFNKWAPLAVAGIGMAIVGASLLAQDLTTWYGMIIFGLLLILGGFWYATNPFLTSERRYHALRTEVGAFIDLVKELNHAATRGEADEVERVKARMFKVVERMARVANLEGQFDQPDD